MSVRADTCWILAVLALGGCGGTAAVYSISEMKTSGAVLEGYSRFWGAFSERAEITSVDRPAKGGIARASLGNVTRAEIEPGDRCVQLEFKNCTINCGETTYCAFADYFVAGQHVQLKPGSLKLDKAGASGEAVVAGSIQIEVTSKGFAPQTRRINLTCGVPARNACASGTPELPRQEFRRR